MADADTTISDHIEALVAEEHRLLDRHGDGGGLQPEEHARLEEVRVELDRLWDLLRQRRAKRGAGQDPDEATERSGPEVEGYLG